MVSAGSMRRSSTGLGTLPNTLRSRRALTTSALARMRDNEPMKPTTTPRPWRRSQTLCRHELIATMPLAQGSPCGKFVPWPSPRQIFSNFQVESRVSSLEFRLSSFKYRLSTFDIHRQSFATPAKKVSNVDISLLPLGRETAQVSTVCTS